MASRCDSITGQSTPEYLTLISTKCLRFVCPSCSQCTAKQFFSQRGCCQEVVSDGKTKSLFHFIDHSKLNESEKVLLEKQLVQDTTEIFDLFDEMLKSLISSIESKRAHVSLLRNFVLSSAVRKHGNKKNIECLERATSISNIFFALGSFTSFFHYEIIERIVIRFGKSCDKKKMKEYIAQFKKYCERNVFEVPSNILCNREPETGDECFLFKYTQDGPKSLQDIANIRWKLATKVLGIDVLSLQLCSITAGCVCLNFLVAAQEADEIIEKTATNESSLSDLHIKFLGASTVPQHSDK